MGHATLIFADRLLQPFYFFVKWIKCILPKKVKETNQYYVIKFFGLGSLTRIAYVIKNSAVDKNKVTFITLKSNKPIVEELQLNAIYIRSANPLYFIADYFKTIFHVWKQKGVHVLDMERSSNFSGIFRVILAIRKPSSGFYFKAMNKRIGNQSFISLMDKPAIDSIVEMFGEDKLKMAKGEVQITYSNQVIINVNAGAYLPQRMYPLSKYAALVAKLHTEFPAWTFLLTGAKSEVSRVEGFINQLEKEGVDAENIHNLSGQQSLSDLLVTIQKVDLVITNDSGPIHFANYFGAKTVGIWGPTSAEMVGYSNSETMLNLISNEDCSPCFINPKSKVAKACAGKLTCFHKHDTEQMVGKIKDFIESSSKKSNIDPH